MVYAIIIYTHARHNLTAINKNKLAFNFFVGVSVRDMIYWWWEFSRRRSRFTNSRETKVHFFNGVKPGARKSFGQYKPLAVYETGRTVVLQQAPREADEYGRRTRLSNKRGALYASAAQAIAANLMRVGAMAIERRLTRDIAEAEANGADRSTLIALSRKRSAIIRSVQL